MDTIVIIILFTVIQSTKIIIQAIEYFRVVILKQQI